MKKRKKLVRDNIKESYEKKSAKEIKAIIILFVLSIIIGALFSDNLAYIDNILKDIISKTEGLTGPQLIFFIFSNNVWVSFIGLILGMFMGIFPIIAITSNGIVLGYVLNKIIAVVGPYELWKLLPHGIFELPAIFIALGMGLRLGIDTTKNYILRNKKNKIKRYLGILSMVLGLAGIAIIREALSIIFSSRNLNESFSAIIIFIIGSLVLAPFVVIFFIQDKKLRDANLKNIRNAFIIFVKIIIPLLIIAAIIEGLLISII